MNAASSAKLSSTGSSTATFRPSEFKPGAGLASKNSSTNTSSLLGSKTSKSSPHGYSSATSYANYGTYATKGTNSSSGAFHQK